MRIPFKQIAVASLLVAGSLGFVLGVLEFVLFRLVVPVTDIPDMVFTDGVIRHAPNQSGVFRIAAESAAAFRINEQGWHSHHPRYTKEKGDKIRVAVVGDSYVAGLEVGTEAMLTNQLEAWLGREDYEVYNFGIGGAPLSHYLYVLREEVSSYEPDLIIIIVVENDLRDSYDLSGGSQRYGSSFFKLVVEEGKVIDEISPQAYRGEWRWLVKSSLFRYFWYQYKIRGSLKEYLGTLHGQTTLANDPVTMDANNRALIAYFMDEIRIYEMRGYDVCIVLGADGTAIETGSLDLEFAEYRPLFADIGEEEGIDVVDLYEPFAARYEREGHPLRFEHDGHWNEYANGLAAELITRCVVGADPSITAETPPTGSW